MIESPIDTLVALCKLERRVPLHTLAEKIGYHPNTIRYHIEHLETLGLVRKASRGFWVPTFDGPYDYESLYARLLIYKAARMAADLPRLAERIMDLVNEIPAGSCGTGTG